MRDLFLPELSGYGMILMPIQKTHLEQLRIWRNSSEISRFMFNPDEITSEQQVSWFKKIGQTVSQLHWSICYKGQLIGTANIKERNGLPIVKKQKAENLTVEPGIYLGDERFRGNLLAFSPSLLLVDYCFEILELSRLQAKVHKDNAAALNYNLKLGYKKVASDDRWISIELTYSDYVEATKVLKQFLLRRTKVRK